MKSVSKVFLTGLVTILPIAATVYVLWWLAVTVQSLFGPLTSKVLPEPARDWPFIGIAFAIAIVFAIGLLMQVYLIRGIFERAQKLLNRLPLVKTLYGSVQDLMSFLGAGDDERKQSRPVLVRIGGSDARLVGLITRDDFSDLPDGLGTKETVAVYLPMSYQIGGFTVMVPRNVVEPIDMSTEDAMRFAVTAGVSKTGDGRAKAERKALA